LELALFVFLRALSFLLPAKDSIPSARGTPAGLQNCQLNWQKGIRTKDSPPHTVCRAQLAWLTQAVYALLPRLNVRYSSWFFHGQKHSGAMGWSPALSTGHRLCCSGTATTDNIVSHSLCCSHKYICPLTLSELFIGACKQSATCQQK